MIERVVREGWGGERVSGSGQLGAVRAERGETHHRRRPLHGSTRITEHKRQSFQLGRRLVDLVQQLRLRVEEVVEGESFEGGDLGESGEEGRAMVRSLLALEEKLFEGQGDTAGCECLRRRRKRISPAPKTKRTAMQTHLDLLGQLQDELRIGHGVEGEQAKGR